MRSDIARIVELVNLAYAVESFFSRAPRTNEADVLQRLAIGSFLLFESPKNLLGSIYLEIDDESASFGLLSVHPESQGQGTGRRLIGAAENRARKQGCRHMSLRVVNLRKELPPFYKRLGYREVGVESFPAPEVLLLPCHFILMRKDL